MDVIKPTSSLFDQTESFSCQLSINCINSTWQFPILCNLWSRNSSWNNFHCIDLSYRCLSLCSFMYTQITLVVFLQRLFNNWKYLLHGRILMIGYLYLDLLAICHFWDDLLWLLFWPTQSELIYRLFSIKKLLDTYKCRVSNEIFTLVLKSLLDDNCLLFIFN